MFDFEQFFHANTKSSISKWKGFPPYNFIGGHNDASMMPVEALRASADKVMQKHGAKLATYGWAMARLAYAVFARVYCRCAGKARRYANRPG